MRKIILMSLLAFLGFARAADFSEGQVWSYKTRAGEEASTFLINKIEFHPKLGSIYHVSVSGVKIKNPRTPTGITSELPHFPVSKETLNKSITKLAGKSKINPEYQQGYQEWKSAFDKGDAGIFTIPVAEIVGVVEKAINQ